MFDAQTLSNKVILVTGGGTGLGFSMSKQFVSLGATVVICGRREDKLQEAVVELCQNGGKASYQVCDVRDYAAVANMIQNIVKTHQQLDCLVNNAAGNFLCPAEDLSPNGFQTVIDIVLNGTFNCSQNFGKYCIEAKRPGAILNIVATYTETGCAFVLPSACAKAGVYAMTTTLAYEWGPYNIRCNSIAPGPFPTDGAWSRLVPDKNFEQSFIQHHPMQRFGKHEELANLAVFLLSDLAPYINGECVTIDGGERLQGAEFNFITKMAPREQLRQMFRTMRPKKSE